jgi:phage shock protein C
MTDLDERLYRSRDDRIVAGVAAGVAESLDADPSVVRVVWAVLIVLTGGLALLVYVVMAIVVPERPAGMEPRSGGAASDPVSADPPPAGSWVAPDGSTVPVGTSPAARTRRRNPNDAARGGLIAGLLLIVLGGLFLLRQLIPALDLGAWWPLAAIGLGIVLIVVAVMPSRHSD